MPNTLAHAGVQGLVSRAALPGAALRWVYLGIVIPDIPWILQRVVHTVMPSVDPYFLRSYVIIQASLLGCLVLCAAFAFVARRFWLIFVVLGGNAVLHLVLDALQTKWANGAHFLAPFSWELTNWGVFWPESIATYGLTAFGLIYIIWYWRPAVQGELDIARPITVRLAGMVALVAGYFMMPALLLQGPIEADTHYLKTLADERGRLGSYVEIDRARYIPTEDGGLVSYYGGAEQVSVENLELESPVTVSIRGVFIEDDTIHVTDHHVHAGGFRNYASYLGLTLILMVWIVALGREALLDRRASLRSSKSER